MGYRSEKGRGSLSELTVTGPKIAELIVALGYAAPSFYRDRDHFRPAWWPPHIPQEKRDYSAIDIAYFTLIREVMKLSDSRPLVRMIAERFAILHQNDELDFYDIIFTRIDGPTVRAVWMLVGEPFPILEQLAQGMYPSKVFSLQANLRMARRFVETGDVVLAPFTEDFVKTAGSTDQEMEEIDIHMGFTKEQAAARRRDREELRAEMAEVRAKRATRFVADSTEPAPVER